MTLKKWYGLLVLSFLIMAATYGAYVSTPGGRNFGRNTNIDDQTEAEVLGSSSRGYKMPVMVISYIPLNSAQQIDKTVTGDVVYTQPAELLNYIKTTTQSAIGSLKNGSKYHGYKNSSTTPSLNYSIQKEIVRYEALPAGLKVPWNDARRPDYVQILNREKICDMVDNKGIREVWLWGYHTSQIEPTESNMSMGTNIKAKWNFTDYGDVSNSERSNDLPICKNTYVLYNLNFARGVGEILENHGHHMEAVMSMYQPAMWSLFVGNPCGPQKVYGCGWTHYPPNVMQYCGGHDYEWYDKTPQQSDCENWTPQRTGRAKPVSCSTWSGSSTCTEDGGVSFKVWWMQNLPGMGNNLKDLSGRNLGNWWRYFGAFDASI